MFATANADRFVAWLTRHLLRKLRGSDVLVMDNLPAHPRSASGPACRHRRIRVLYLPPYSPDLNPNEPGWALQEQQVWKHGPRTPITCDASPAARAIALRPGTAATGLRMLVTTGPTQVIREISSCRMRVNPRLTRDTLEFKMRPSVM
jgi:hypothetical protein